MLIKSIKSIAAFLCALATAISGAPEAVPEVSNVRALWVSTVYNIDYPSKQTSDAQSLMRDADVILDNCQGWGINTLFLQVRPTCDAIYKSDVFPWSVYLSGTHGVPPTDGFDALSYFIEGAHARGMELHAWINPYKATRGGDIEYKSLAQNSPAKLYPQLLMKAQDGNYYLDPSKEEARSLILRGVAEIVQNYAVDGIHFDDYFYPNAAFDDSAQFALSGASDIYAWRRENVNTLVRDVRDTVHALKPECKFGISPCGIWANKTSDVNGSDTNGFEGFNRIYADSRKWVREGYVDYICPQLYWNVGFAGADYQTLCDWWANTVDGTAVKLYIGMAAYKVGDEAYGDAWASADEIARQMVINQNKASICGECYYSYSSILNNAALQNLLKNK